MTITLRTTKGSPLTFTEMDDNFREILDLRRISIDQVTAGGTPDELTADFTRAVSLANGVIVKVKIADTNTEASPTLNVNASGAKTIAGLDGTPVGAGTLPAGAIILFSYDAGLDAWIALNFASTDAVTLAGELPNFYLQCANFLGDDGPLDAACLPDATTTEKGAIRVATQTEVEQGTVDDAAVTPLTVGAASPTNETHVGGPSITTLTPTKKYLVNVYGVTKDRGSGITTLGSVTVVEGTSSGGTTVLGTTPTTSINWPDGAAPQSASFIITATTANITGVTDRLSNVDNNPCLHMTAVRLD